MAFLKAFVILTAFAFARPSQASQKQGLAQKCPQTPFLKEILLGRCYFRPPTGAQGDYSVCPSLVDTILAAFEGRNDRDIAPQDFSKYLDAADWSTPEDAGLFWIGKNAAAAPSANTPIQHLLVQPQDTPGGALLDGLVFCGNDLRDKGGCPLFFFSGEQHQQRRRRLDAQQEQQAAQQQQQQAQQEQEQQAQEASRLQQQQAQQEEAARDHHKKEEEASQKQEDTVEKEKSHPWIGAQASFWAGAYENFASGLAGRIQLVVAAQNKQGGMLDDDLLLFLKAAVPNLDPNKVSRVDIHLVAEDASENAVTCSNSDVVSVVKAALAKSGIGPVTCTEDPFLLNLTLCTDMDSDACHLVSECMGTDHDQPPVAASPEESTAPAEVEPKQDKKHHHLSFLAFLAMVILLGMAIFIVVRALDIGAKYDTLPEVDVEEEEKRVLQ